MKINFMLNKSFDYFLRFFILKRKLIKENNYKIFAKRSI